MPSPEQPMTPPAAENPAMQVEAAARAAAELAKPGWSETTQYGAAVALGHMGAEKPAELPMPQAAETPGPRFVQPEQPFRHTPIEGKPSRVQVVKNVQERAPQAEKKRWYNK